MRHFDIIKWLWVAGIIYTFLQGYTFYMQRQGEIAVGCSFLCAFCIFQFIRRLHTLYYLHMKMKNIDKLNGRAFERYLTVQFRHLGYHVTLSYKSLSSARWKLEKPVGGILGRGQENTECLGNENLLD